MIRINLYLDWYKIENVFCVKCVNPCIYYVIVICYQCVFVWLVGSTKNIYSLGNISSKYNNVMFYCYIAYLQSRSTWQRCMLLLCYDVDELGSPIYLNYKVSIYLDWNCTIRAMLFLCSIAFTFYDHGMKLIIMIATY